jgi:hypothetical protein
VRTRHGCACLYCNPSIQEAEAEDLELEASLGYIAKPHFKSKIRLGMVAHTYNPTTQKAEIGRSTV